METSIQTDVDHFVGRKQNHVHIDFISADDYQFSAILPSIVIGVLRVYLSRENKRRDKLEAENHVASNGFVETTTTDGIKVVHEVDTNQLDLTDRENLKL